MPQKNDIDYINHKKQLKRDNVKEALFLCPEKEIFVDITEDIIPNILPIYKISNMGRIFNIKSGNFYMEK